MSDVKFTVVCLDLGGKGNKAPKTHLLCLCVCQIISLLLHHIHGIGLILHCVLAHCWCVVDGVFSGLGTVTTAGTAMLGFGMVSCCSIFAHIDTTLKEHWEYLHSGTCLPAQPTYLPAYFSGKWAWHTYCTLCGPDQNGHVLIFGVPHIQQLPKSVTLLKGPTQFE